MALKKSNIMAALVALSLSAFAADTFYVSTTGEDDAERSGGEDEPFATLNYALSRCAKQYTTILLEDGEYMLESTPEVLADGRFYDLVIRSRSGNRDAVVLDGQGKVRCLAIKSAVRTTVADMTFRNGYLEPIDSTSCYDNAGAGILTHNSSATITNCVIKNCHVNAKDSQSWGGGIHMENQSALLVDSILENCSVSNHYVKTVRSSLGGGLCLWGCTARNSIVRNCTMWSDRSDVATPLVSGGGGVYARTDSVIEDCQILDNLAENGNKTVASYQGSGGGVFLNESVISNSLVSGNVAAAMGGGLLLTGGFKVYGCTISGNTVVADYTAGYLGSGGGIYAQDCSASVSKTLESCLIADNTNLTTTAAAPMGGGLMCDGVNTLTVRDCAFVGNRAITGGALALAKRNGTQLTTKLAFTNCLFKANFSEKQGGALEIQSIEDVSFRDCWFLENENHVNYGALAHVASSYNREIGLGFRNCLFRKNKSQGGNTLFDVEAGSYNYPVAMEYCTFVSNRADLALLYPGKTQSASLWTVKGCVFADDMRRKDYPNLFWPAFHANFADYGANITFCSCYSDANYPAGENGNLAVGMDEKFTDPGANNFRPTLKSPLKAAGGTAADWMTGAKDLGQGDPLVETVGTYGVSIVRVKAKDRLLNGNPTIGCSEAWEPGGLMLLLR